MYRINKDSSEILLFQREVDAYSIKTTATVAYSTQAPEFSQTVAYNDVGLILP